MKVLYLDESGSQNFRKVEPSYPVFVLGGIIVDRVYARTKLEDRLRAFKETFFGRDDIVLHTADIVRARNGFESLTEPASRARFLEALNAMIEELEFQVVARVMMGSGSQSPLAAHANPYRSSLDVLVERFCEEIGPIIDGGIICAESRRPDLDRDLHLAWEQLRRRGTSALTGATINERIVELAVKEKPCNIAGLQLADLVVSPIARRALGKPPHRDWDIVSRKILRGGLSVDGDQDTCLP
jgi:hypothetical protein